ncbi:MAG: ECF transporter S component [Anaerolineae bacterium]
MSTPSTTTGSSVLNTRRIVVAGLLGAITILLGATRLMFISVPTPVGDATIGHIPVILGGVLEGSVVGGILGLLFGIFSFFWASIPAFKDPLVAVLPRILIGITSALAFRGLRRWNEPIAVVVAAAIGSLTNTIGVLGMGVLLGYWPLAAALTVGASQGVLEAIVAAIIVGAVVLVYRGTAGRARRADL